MTPFQSEAKRQISTLGDQIGQRIRDEIVRPDNAYYSGKIDEYQFWIYDSGDADFKSPWYSKVFEKIDYDDDEMQLLGAFISKLRLAIVNKDELKRNPPRRRPLLNRMREFFNFSFWGIWFGSIASLFLASVPIRDLAWVFGLGAVLSSIGYALRSKPRAQLAFNLIVSLMWALFYFGVGYPDLKIPDGVLPVFPVIILAICSLIPFGLFVLFRRKKLK